MVSPDFQNTPIEESDQTSAVSILQTARKSTAQSIPFNNRDAMRRNDRNADLPSSQLFCSNFR
jgi:hypothetical protein